MMHRRSRGRSGLGVLSALVVVGLVFAGCGASDNGGVVVGGPVQRKGALPPAGQLRDRLPAAIASAGVLRVGSSVGRAPLLFFGTGTRQPTGAEYDIAQGIARQLGVSLQVTELPRANLGPAVLGGQIDVFLSSFVDLKVFEGAGIDFVDYLIGRSAVLVRQGNPGHVSGPDDLCGRTVALLAGTAQQVTAVHLASACVGRHRQAPDVRSLATPDAVQAELASGRVVAVLDDAVVASYAAQSSSGPGAVQVVGASVEPVNYGIGVARAAPQLRDAMQQALRAIIADGEYDQALAKWGAEPAALRSAPVNAGQ